MIHPICIAAAATAARNLLKRDRRGDGNEEQMQRRRLTKDTVSGNKYQVKSQMTSLMKGMYAHALHRPSRSVGSSVAIPNPRLHSIENFACRPKEEFPWKNSVRAACSLETIFIFIAWRSGRDEAAAAPRLREQSGRYNVVEK